MKILKKFMKLTLLFILIINILSCKRNNDKMEIIWRDYTENGYNGIIEIGLAFDINNINKGYEHFFLKANETKYIENKNMTNIYFNKHSGDISVDFYHNSKFPNKLEIFMIDRAVNRGENNVWIVPYHRDVIAYFIEIYDSNKERCYNIISQDNYLLCEYIYEQNEINDLNQNDIFKIIKKKDFGYYSPVKKPVRYSVDGYNGIMIKSMIDGNIIGLSSANI